MDWSSDAETNHQEFVGLLRQTTTGGFGEAETRWIARSAIHQELVGLWPMGDDGRLGEAERDGFVERSRDESTKV